MSNTIQVYLVSGLPPYSAPEQEIQPPSFDIFCYIQRESLLWVYGSRQQTLYNMLSCDRGVSLWLHSMS